MASGPDDSPRLAILAAGRCLHGCALDPCQSGSASVLLSGLLSWEGHKAVGGSGPASWKQLRSGLPVPNHGRCPDASCFDSVPRASTFKSLAKLNRTATQGLYRVVWGI